MARSLKQHFTDWCRQQGEREYDYANPRDCAFCQFLADQGYAANPRVTCMGWSDGILSKDIRLPNGVEKALVSRPWNFAALADRLSA